MFIFFLIHFYGIITFHPKVLVWQKNENEKERIIYRMSKRDDQPNDWPKVSLPETKRRRMIERLSSTQELEYVLSVCANAQEDLCESLKILSNSVGREEQTLVALELISATLGMLKSLELYREFHEKD